MDERTKLEIEAYLTHPKKGLCINLKQEKLLIADYEWLSNIIKKSSFVETLLLPIIPEHEADKILSLLNKGTSNNSTLINIELKYSISLDSMSIKIQSLHDKIQLRLNRNRNKIFAIHGGGNIGLGMMADIVSRSAIKYNIVATSNNRLMRTLINSVNKLWIQHGSTSPLETTCIENIRMVSREQHDIIQLYSEASLVALCVTPSVMPGIAKDIAHALLKRYEFDGSGVKILVLMNLPNCANYVLELVSAELSRITQNELHSKQILDGVEFIPTVIDRIVTPISEKRIKEQLLPQIPEELLEHRKSILGNTSDEALIHAIENLTTIAKSDLKFNLFNAEKLFSMHVDESFPEAYRFPEMQITKDLSVIETIKNKFINGPHAILAWIGALLGCTTIAESINNPTIFTFIKEMMENEIRPILSSEYPEITNEELIALEHTFFKRCSASTDDLVTRVGRDPLRKLDSGGRIRGTLELAQKHRLNIPTPRLEHGLAVGFLYGVKKIDPTNPGCQKIREIYKKNNKSFAAVLCYQGVAPSGEFSGLDPKTDKKLLDRVINKMHEFNNFWERNLTPGANASTSQSTETNSTKTQPQHTKYNNTIWFPLSENVKIRDSRPFNGSSGVNKLQIANKR